MPLNVLGPPAPGSASGRAALLVTHVPLLAPTAVTVSVEQAMSFSYDAYTDGKGFFDYFQVNVVTDRAIVPSDTFFDLTASRFHIIMEARD